MTAVTDGGKLSAHKLLIMISAHMAQTVHITAIVISSLYQNVTSNSRTRYTATLALEISYVQYSFSDTAYRDDNTVPVVQRILYLTVATFCYYRGYMETSDNIR